MDPTLTAAQHERLDHFADLVAASPHNLVSRRARQELRSRHVPESVALARLLPAGPRLLDVGSGGGFPGLVVAICRPDLEVTLLDATRKKTAFLADAARELGLDLRVLTGRAEDLGRDPALAGRFDLVTARAVAALDQLLPWTLPFLRLGGHLYAVKGDRWREELAATARSLPRFGAQVVATPDDLPGDSATEATPRVVIIARAR